MSRNASSKFTPLIYLLSAEAPAGAEKRDAFASVAGEYGMRVRIPTEAELVLWRQRLIRDHVLAPPDGRLRMSVPVTMATA